jgi:peptidoglycan/xylan/chitin deacetylase (PgdA/CDA1 family)
MNAWMRRAAAGCYFHSGAPSLMRRLRERYELSFAGGERRKLAFHRRRHCSARILYYHRVNDENDPFFHAVPTAVFEQHMRYLARHYRIVSLAEVVRHLQEDASPEMLVGITFDDGYEDNYRNAFPILKRYNLPATIFLTTGSIDSGEPLWFERLAEALKKSPKEFVDLDLDSPQRLWLRTHSERLEANGRIFSILRNLNDEERNRRVAEILRRLCAGETSDRSHRMLSWEQVRLMKSQGIDFGGHTVTHPFVSRLTAPQLEWEVAECKRRIEEELQEAVSHFAYPHGRDCDFNPTAKEALRAAGYKAAVTTIWGMNSPLTDRMELRRGGPWESDAALFACKLDWYQLANE